MSQNKLQTQPKRIWVIDKQGIAVEQKEKPKALTSGQRHYMYRVGLMAVDQFVRQRGFVSNTEASSTKLSYEKYDKGSYVWIDISIKNPANVAYVTSYQGYEYKKESIGKTKDGQERYGINAKVTYAKDVMGCEHMIQINVSTNDSRGSHNPIFIALPKDLENPAKHVMQNVLGVLALACEKIPKAKEAFNSADIQKAQNQPIESNSLKSDFIPLLD